MVNWISYIIVIILTALFVSIITENIVIKRIANTEGVQFIAGKCRLKDGYGPLKEQK